MSWYQAKSKYQQEQENGEMKTLTDTYLLDAVSFTDAEARMYEIMNEQNIADHAVGSISRKNLSDVFDDETSEKWWQAKTVYMSLNEMTGKERRIVNNILVRADDIKAAHSALTEGLKTMLIPYEIEAIVLTPIMDVYGKKTQ